LTEPGGRAAYYFLDSAQVLAQKSLEFKSLVLASRIEYILVTFGLHPRCITDKLTHVHQRATYVARSNQPSGLWKLSLKE